MVLWCCIAEHSLRKVSQIACPFYTSEVAVLNVDQNSLSTLVGVECYPKLIQVRQLARSYVSVSAVLLLMLNVLMWCDSCQHVITV